MAAHLIELSELNLFLRRMHEEIASAADQAGEEHTIGGTFEPIGLSGSEVAELENSLACHLPSSFKAAIQQHCFDSLDIGSTWFSERMGDTFSAALYGMNVRRNWWGTNVWKMGELAPPIIKRPDEWLYIASGDPYGLFLQLNDGSLYCWDNEKHWSEAKFVASDILQLVRCLASLWMALTANQDRSLLLADILELTAGYKEFWEYYAV